MRVGTNRVTNSLELDFHESIAPTGARKYFAQLVDLKTGEVVGETGWRDSLKECQAVAANVIHDVRACWKVA